MLIRPRSRSTAALALAAALVMTGGCSSALDADDADPASLGFQHYYLCSGDADVVKIGKRSNAQECLAACETASNTLLNGAAKACWWLDGSAGLPAECRLCKTTAPVKDIFINNWAMSLPAAR